MKSSDHVVQLLERLGRLVSNAQNTNGFKPVQWEVLRYLSEANVFSRNPGSLVEYLGITKGTVSQTISTLEDRGLLRKKSDKTDRRAVKLELTAAGRAALVKNPIKALSRSVESLSETEQGALAESLDLLLRRHLAQRERKLFGQCKDCMHFRDESDEFRCGLLDVPLESEVTVDICAEFETSIDSRSAT